MKKVTLVLVMFFVCGLLSSCGSLVGRSVDMSSKEVCHTAGGSGKCTKQDKNFVITYRVKKLGGNRYSVQGTAKYTGSITFTDFSGAVFRLLLVSQGKVVKSVTIGGGSGNLDRGLTFSREFVSEQKFDAVLLTYHMNVRG